jgi:hypothetical protein
MEWRVTIELNGADGTKQTYEVARGGGTAPHSPLDPLGLTLETLRRAKPRAVPPLDTMTVSIDAGHVRAARGHQGRKFEVMAAQVSNDDAKPVLSSGVPGEADQQCAQLNGVLSGLGMTVDAEVTILSDGADGPRSLGEAPRAPERSFMYSTRSTWRCAPGTPLNAPAAGRMPRFATVGTVRTSPMRSNTSAGAFGMARPCGRSA